MRLLDRMLDLLLGPIPAGHIQPPADDAARTTEERLTDIDARLAELAAVASRTDAEQRELDNLLGLRHKISPAPGEEA